MAGECNELGGRDMDSCNRPVPQSSSQPGQSPLSPVDDEESLMGLGVRSGISYKVKTRPTISVPDSATPTGRERIARRREDNVSSCIQGQNCHLANGHGRDMDSCQGQWLDDNVIPRVTSGSARRRKRNLICKS